MIILKDIYKIKNIISLHFCYNYNEVGFNCTAALTDELQNTVDPKFAPDTHHRLTYD